VLVVNGHVYPQMQNANVGSKYSQRMLLFHNEHDGTFSEVAARVGEALMLPRVSRGLAFGDIDNDGNIDVVVENLDGKPTILRNDGGNSNQWITLKLTGKQRNRDAIGARVKVVAGDLVQWDELRAGDSYLSCSDKRLHFGLGRNGKVDSIEIHWPDGQMETLHNLAAGQFVFVEEGKGVTRLMPPRR